MPGIFIAAQEGERIKRLVLMAGNAVPDKKRCMLAYIFLLCSILQGTGLQPPEI